MPYGHKDPGSIAAEVMMTRMVHDGAFLVVEGVTDVRFWSTRRHVTCELVDGEGKPNVVGSVQRLNAKQIEGVLGVVDDDYDSFVGTDLGTDNIVRVDAHDLESLLCRSAAFEKVLAEFGNASKIQRFEATEGEDVRSSLLRRALVFGRIRLAATLHKLEIDRAAIRVQRFVDVETWKVDQEELFRAVVGNDALGRMDLVTRCAGLAAADPWRVVHGHDVIDLLRIGLQRVLGDIRSSVGPKQIAGVLRAGFETGDLQATGLWTEMRTWESRSDVFRILRE